MIEFEEVSKVIKKGQTSDVTKLLNDEPDLINFIFKSRGQSCNILNLAVQQNNSDLVRILLESGATPYVEDELRDNLIYRLILTASHQVKPDEEILRLLVANGVTFPVNNKKNASSFIGYYMENIYKYDLVSFFSEMCKLGFDPVAVERLTGSSLIIKALEGRYQTPSKVAEFLLEQGCSLNEIEPDPGSQRKYGRKSYLDDYLEDEFKSPLAAALDSYLYCFVKKLLDNGAEKAKVGCLPHQLAKHTDIPMYLRDILLENSDLNELGAESKPPIFLAIDYNNSGYITYLAENGANINIVVKSLTPLMYAVKTHRKQAVKRLVELGADLNTLDAKWQTALDIALTLPGFKKTCDMMIKAGAQTSIKLSAKSDDSRNIIENINNAIQPGEVWANTARQTLTSLAQKDADLWHQLIRHCLSNNSAKPSAKWLKDAYSLIEKLGEKSFRTSMLAWLPLIKEKRLEPINSQDADYYYYGNTDHVVSENNTRLLRGFIWLCSRFVDDEISRMLRELAVQMYKKVYGVGMRNAKLANAALYSLSLMPGTVGLKEIIVLRAATRYNPALVNINRVFDKLAQDSGKTPDELAELSTPDYGLTGIGEYTQLIGDVGVSVSLLSEGKCDVVWQVNGKTQKSVPAAIKEEYADDIKQIKVLVKELQQGCAAHCQRLEQMYLRRQSLTCQTWLQQYMDHNLIGFLARRLIWRVTVNEQYVDVIYTGNGFVTHQALKVDIPADALIDLWHPRMSAPKDVLAWRNYLIENTITQPFKQAHREIYILTDAERSTKYYSLRFANHILKHNQFHALATQRGWQQHRGGQWDGGNENSAYKKFAAYGLDVTFDAEGAESYDDLATDIYQCVATGQLSFSKDKPIDLADVDPLLFSEVMRDLDLFVGVASIGNDPGWRDRENAYWLSSSFGELNESAKVRQDVLTALIPKLQIAPLLKIEGRFLVVKGKLTSYKIHLGSSNILMSPNDSYLCIVEVKSQSKLMLPFEGDHTLSVILSKAMMLAHDSKITDQTILSQIHQALS